MSEVFGISGSWSPSRLKRELLFFDKVVLTDPHIIRGFKNLFDLTYPPSDPAEELSKLNYAVSGEIANFDFLQENGCIVDSTNFGFDYSFDRAFETVGKFDSELGELYQSYRSHASTRRGRTHPEWVQSLQAFIKAREIFADAITVFIAEDLRRRNIDAISLSKRFDQNDVSTCVEGPVEQRQAVSHVILEKIPVPSEGVSFERILEFRSDNEAMGYLAGLRNWMNKVSKLEKSSLELSQELEWLKFKHAERLSKYKIETQLSTLSSIFVGSFEIVEKALKLQWGDAAKVAISLVGNKEKCLGFDIDPEAGELNFLVRTDNAFGPDS